MFATGFETAKTANLICALQSLFLDIQCVGVCLMKTKLKRRQNSVAPTANCEQEGQ